MLGSIELPRILVRRNCCNCPSLYIREKFYIGLNCVQSIFLMLTFFFVLSFLFILIIIIYYYYIKKRNKRNKNKEKREGKNRSDQNDKILVLLRTKFLYIDRGGISACDVLIHSLFYLHPYLFAALFTRAALKGCHCTLAHRHQALSLGNLPRKRLRICSCGITD